MIKLFFILVGIFGLQFLFSTPALATISFTISNPVINSSDEIEIDASISGLISSSCSTNGCYLQSAIRVQDETKGYFGQTYNNSGEYVDYFSSASSTDEIKSKLFNFVPVSGAWSGKIKAKNNSDSSNYIGAGSYTLKFRRFSGNSTSATSGDSNTISITLAASLPSPSPSPSISPSPSVSQTPSPASVASPKPSTTPSPIILPTPVPIASPESEATSSEMILGINTATDEATVEASFESTQSGVQTPGIFGMSPLFLGLTGGGLAFLSTSGYLFYRSSRFGRIDTNVQDS